MYGTVTCCRLSGASGMSGHVRRKKDCRGVLEVGHRPQEQHCNRVVGFCIFIVAKIIMKKHVAVVPFFLAYFYIIMHM